MPMICEIITHERFWGSVYMPDVYVVFGLFLVILTVTLRVIFFSAYVFGHSKNFLSRCDS